MSTPNMTELVETVPLASSSPPRPRSRRATRPRPPRRPAAPAYAAGLDVGYAAVKWLASDGTRHWIPTAVAPLDLDPLPRTPQADDRLVRVDGASYLVGAGALWSSRCLTDHLRWDTWWQSIPYRAMLAALADRIPPNGLIVTGVPLSLPLTVAISTPIEQLLTEMLGARQVIVTQQGLAAALALDLLGKPGHAALIDIGGRTTECVTVRHGQVHAATCRGLRLGVCELYDALAEDYRRQWGWDLDGALLDAVLRGDASLPGLYAEDPTWLQTVRTRLAALAQPLGERLLAVCRELWGDGRWLDQVIVCGGGASVFLESIQHWRRDARVPEQSPWLNAQGYLRIAQEAIAEPAADPADAETDRR